MPSQGLERYDLIMPDEPLPADAQMCVISVQSNQVNGVAYEVVACRARRVVHVFKLISHGRRFYRSLEYSSDARFCLRALQPSCADRSSPWA
eukprot:2179093-Prymnesium_polylepis.1